MSSLSIFLSEVVDYEGVDRIGSKLCLIKSNMVTVETSCANADECPFWEQSRVLPIGKFPSPVLPRNMTMLQHIIIQFFFYYLWNGHLQEVKSNRKCQTASSSGRGRIERCSLANMMIWHGNFDILENQPLRRGVRERGLVCFRVLRVKYVGVYSCWGDL